MAFRDGPFEDLKVPLTWTAALAVIVAGVAGVLLLLGDRRETLKEEGYGAVRGAVDRVAAPANGVFAAPVRWTGQAGDWIDDYFFAISENRRLKQRVAELERVREHALALQNTNARYAALLKIRTDPPVPMVAARTVSESRGPFANARLIDTGSKMGVKVGNPVMNETGLVGRVVGVTGGVSRVLLLTDVASRTPVLVNRSDARAILVGDGGAHPRLEFVRGEDSIKVGDQILSSGDGGVFPRGLPVGVAVKGLDGSWRVRLYADRGAIDFVRVLLFQDFSQLADTARLTPPPLTALGSAAPPPATGSGAATPPATAAPPAQRPVAGSTAPRPASAVPATASAAQPPTAATTSLRPQTAVARPPVSTATPAPRPAAAAPTTARPAEARPQ